MTLNKTLLARFYDWQFLFSVLKGEIKWELISSSKKYRVKSQNITIKA
jgi:hypothetical protein